MKHVNSLKQTLQINYKINLFSDGPAISISTGKEVDAGMKTELLNSKTLGNESYLTFVNDRLITGKKSFFDTITKNKVLTGNEITKKKKTKEIVLLRNYRSQSFVVKRLNIALPPFHLVLLSLKLNFIKVINLV